MTIGKKLSFGWDGANEYRPLTRPPSKREIKIVHGVAVEVEVFEYVKREYPKVVKVGPSIDISPDHWYAPNSKDKDTARDRQRRIDEKDKKANDIVQCIQEGKTVYKTAESVGCSPWYVKKVLKKRNIPHDLSD